MTRAKTDCFAYKPGRQNPRLKAERTALDKLYCRDGECRFYKDRQDMAGYTETECNNIQNSSIEQQNVAEHPESEYGNTQNTSMVGKLIRAQAEQIREDPCINRRHCAWIEDAEKYITEKCGIRGDADGQKDS